MSKNHSAGLGELIAERERELAFLRALQAAESDPKLRALAHQALGSPSAPAHKERPTVRLSSPGTAADRIIAHLRSAGRAESIATLAELAGCSESAVRQVLYKSHKHLFSSTDDPSGRRKLFSLKPEGGA